MKSRLLVAAIAVPVLFVILFFLPPVVLAVVTAALCAVALLVVFYFAYLSPQVIQPANRYKQADALFAAGQYEDALVAFDALGEYKDSAAQAEKCQTAIQHPNAHFIDNIGISFIIPFSSNIRV